MFNKKISFSAVSKLDVIKEYIVHVNTLLISLALFVYLCLHDFSTFGPIQTQNVCVTLSYKFDTQDSLIITHLSRLIELSHFLPIFGKMFAYV